MSPQDTRTLLLETALNLIWNSNYNAVGVNEICKQAGVTKGSFYHHFESKAELFCQASNHYWDSIKQDLDGLLSPINTPLEQLENWIAFIFANKLGNDEDNIPGCAFFNASTQAGCCDETVTQALQLMSERGRIYNAALVRTLQAGNYLEGNTDAETLARLLQQYVQGAISHARINRDLTDIKRDLPEGIYRILGLKTEYWFTTKPTWSKASAND
jgi:TetR/AcrR family transcriptional repressor of nem operon